MSIGCFKDGTAGRAAIICGALALSAALFVTAGLAGPAVAEPAPSANAKGERSSIALLSAGRMPDGAWRAGLSIALEPGFKTYWRDPGDSGVPPVFDWSGSRNVARVEVEWPAPRRFFDGVGWSIGYKDDVVLPLRVVAQDAGAPVVLDLKLDYAVCEKLCIPTGGHVARELTESAEDAAALAPFVARVPREVAVGEEAAGLAVETAAIERKGDDIAVVARIAGGGLEDVFVEGESGWYFDKAELTRQNDGRTLARVPVADRPKAVAGPTAAKLTVVGKAGAISVAARLDAVAKAR
ncbi:protein-disulfide reductase DsbD domain-containing protein [Chelatococcus daeguensis]|uniref:protein-disulfide reductase DsbD domain-containing protein n=1 Tax=Chelatococcus daeguensis TaxID=444444 RepID=UPI000B0A403D|nr:protein-disulfide reductase DsbD domain-containing protein [Chelatococcus daeguensis]